MGITGAVTVARGGEDRDQEKAMQLYTHPPSFHISLPLVATKVTMS